MGMSNGLPEGEQRVPSHDTPIQRVLRGCNHTTKIISLYPWNVMVNLCLGWEVSSIRENLVFETDGSYDDPDPEKYSEVINQWWVDLLQYLAEFKGLDVFACSGNMHFFDDDEVRIIGILVEFGWVLSHNSYDPDDHGVRSEHKDFASLQAFINDQHSKSNPIPPPKVHISEWYEHDFIYLETQVSMLLEDRQKREEKQKRWAEKKEKGLCDIYDCNNAANLSYECEYCLGQYCNEHRDGVRCGCGLIS